MLTQEKRPSEVFERHVGEGKNIRVMMYPMRGEEDSLRIDVIYHLTRVKKGGQDLVMGDNYRCGDNLSNVLNWLRKRFSNSSINLKKDELRDIGEVVAEGCKYFGKPEPQTAKN
jgi:hypothetical protein